MEEKNRNSAAKIKANNKYTKEHYKRYAVYVPIEEAQQMETVKGSSSANAFILEAIREKIGKKPENPGLAEELQRIPFEE